MFGPVMEKITEQFAENDLVEISKVNVDEDHDTAALHNVRSIPALIYLKDGETVYQSVDGLITSSTFTATVLSYDAPTNTVRLINTLGTANNSALLYGATSGTSRVVLQQQSPDFITFSGNITYLENREPVQRNADGSEIFKLVLGY
jgi:hypothetical protein